MDKIPVGRTISEAYAFAFRRFPGNLGVVWAPALLVLATVWYVFFPGINGWVAVMPQGPVTPEQMQPMLEAAGKLYRTIALLWIVLILLRAEMMLGLTRRALGLSTGPSVVFLSLGKPYWRLAGAYFAVVIILMAVELMLGIALGIGAVALGVGAGVALQGEKVLLMGFAGFLVAVVVVAAVCVMFYVAVRLTFLLTPVIVAEDRFDLFRGWQMARGNFWRIFVIGVAIFVPVSLLLAAIYVPVEFGALMPHLHSLAPSANPQEAAAHVRDLMHAFHDMFLARWYVFVVLGVLASALLYGIAAGAAASAYRALTGAKHAA